MKLLLGIFLTIAVGLLILWKFGISGFDPAQQGQNLMATVKPGMTWQQVLDIHEPGKFRATGVDADGMVIFASPVKFTREGIIPDIKNPGFPNGFAFEYMLSNDYHYRVDFDGEGKVLQIYKVESFKLPLP